MHRIGPFALILLLAGLAHAQQPVGEQYEGNPTVISDVTVIDVIEGVPIPHQTVVVRYGKIDQILGAAEYKTPGWMTAVDGRGLYLIPGLWDAHVHLSFWDEPQLDSPETPRETDANSYREVMARLSAWGVTSVRDMGGDLDAIDAWRARAESGEIVGPRVLRAGPYVDGPKDNDKYRVFVTSPKEGRKSVVSLSEKGVDFIKIHSQVPPEALAALTRVARKKKLPVAGHVPYGASLDDLIDMKVSTVEHVDAFFISRLGSRQGSFEQWKAAFDWYATAEGRALLARMADGGMAFTPTLAIFDSGWEGVEQPWAQLRGWYREIAAIAHRAGVPILAGTDTARKTGAIQAGIGLHQELKTLVEIGLTPAEALRAATVNPAQLMGRGDELGTVEPGKQADLVLLKKNPLEDIRNTRAIEAVILRGRLLGPEQLAELREPALRGREGEPAIRAKGKG